MAMAGISGALQRYQDALLHNNDALLHCDGLQLFAFVLIAVAKRNKTGGNTLCSLNRRA